MLAAEGFTLTPAQDKGRDVLISDAVHSALGGGARSGKTFLLCRQVLVRALREDGSRHVIFRFRFNALWASVVLDTMPKVIKTCFPDLPSMDDMLNKKMGYMTLPNGSEVWFAGLDDKDRTEKILGMEFATEYFNECSQIPWPSIVIARTRLAQKCTHIRLKAFYDFNPPSKKHWTYLQFVEKKNPESKQPLPNPFNFGFYMINPADNKTNLGEGFLEELEGLPERAKKRFLHGQFADDAEGALWTEELLDVLRLLGAEGETPLPEMVRIVVAVDPSGCSGPEDYRSDEVGIVVVGLGVDQNAYVMEDLSGRYKPERWAEVVADAYQRHKADRIVGESNFGGDMVRATVHTANPDLPYKEVTASRGKVVRAEPVSSLYEKGRVHHVGYYPEIEDQLCSFLVSGYSGMRSPDRADALIWAIAELFPALITQYDPDKPDTRTASRVNTSDRTKNRRRI